LEFVKKKSFGREVNGSRALSLGIQFDEVSPRVRGAFLAFAEGTGNFDKARNRTGQG